jgi:hypothetical protein
LVTSDLNSCLHQSLISTGIIPIQSNITVLGGGDVQTFRRCSHAFMPLQI